MSAAWHLEKMRNAGIEKIAAEKRQAAATLMHEAAALVGNHAEQIQRREEARTYLDAALDAAARQQEHLRRAIQAGS